MPKYQQVTNVKNKVASHMTKYVISALASNSEVSIGIRFFEIVPVILSYSHCTIPPMLMAHAE